MFSSVGISVYSSRLWISQGQSHYFLSLHNVLMLQNIPVINVCFFFFRLPGLWYSSAPGEINHCINIGGRHKPTSHFKNNTCNKTTACKFPPLSHLLLEAGIKHDLTSHHAWSKPGGPWGEFSIGESDEVKLGSWTHRYCKLPAKEAPLCKPHKWALLKVDCLTTWNRVKHSPVSPAQIAESKAKQMIIGLSLKFWDSLSYSYR